MTWVRVSSGLNVQTAYFVSPNRILDYYSNKEYNFGRNLLPLGGLLLLLLCGHLGTGL